MRPKILNGKNLIQFKDLGILFGTLITAQFTCMVVLRMKPQIFQLTRL